VSTTTGASQRKIRPSTASPGERGRASPNLAPRPRDAVTLSGRGMNRAGTSRKGAVSGAAIARSAMTRPGRRPFKTFDGQAVARCLPRPQQIVQRMCRYRGRGCGRGWITRKSTEEHPFTSTKAHQFACWMDERWPTKRSCRVCVSTPFPKVTHFMILLFASHVMRLRPHMHDDVHAALAYAHTCALDLEYAIHGKARYKAVICVASTACGVA
jgi:hypothetical protein